ncbi:HNH homing endonuclease 3 [Bacillus phage BSP10]|uniref:HNH endonuclease n=1 Tax=Bacillus phage SPG24 TaxID=1497851 RepID=UPI000CA34B37|nr:HNH endonuclease [Bacillus phage SPG24]ATN94422.1 HNH homing endonuclease [Bacillus phage BSP9]AUO79488.1 HNH homing endonuclease 3 [Bacillus phage BSP10]AYJ75415.1 HNH homing endonuclease 2 [Bacillus phage BSP21]QRI44681.1 HNH homing endonuclease [Bacillus phage BSTP3]UPI13429.1 hypothetical protein [Bacillus phage SBSphiJ7]
MLEIWKSLSEVVEYGNNYEVSNLGNIRNKQTGRLLKGRLNPKGYLGVNLYLNGKSKYYSVHRLVATAFLPNPEGKPQVNHIKGDEKQNNSVTNLEWVTGHENIQHAFSTGLQKARKGESNSKSVLREDDVVNIKTALTAGVSQYKLASLYKVSRSTIRSIQNGSSWAHVKVTGFTPFSKNVLGESNCKAKLTAEKVSKIREMYRTGEYSQRELGKRFNVSKTTIANIINNKIWSHVI